LGDVTGKRESVENSVVYVAAPGTALQLNRMASHGWNCVVPPCGALSVGAASWPGPAPVTVKLRVADHGPVSTVPLTALTRQKYVPFARPLTVACVTLGKVESWAARSEKFDALLTSQL
jgi:hypothetical protein